MLPIRTSTWHVKAKKNRKEVGYIIKDVIVAGTPKDVFAMVKSEYYLHKIYRNVYGKPSTAVYEEAYKKRSLRIIKVTLSNKILGYGKGNL